MSTFLLGFISVFCFSKIAVSEYWINFFTGLGKTGFILVNICLLFYLILIAVWLVIFFQHSHLVVEGANKKSIKKSIIHLLLTPVSPFILIYSIITTTYENK